jgi:uncharacterized membrane protein YdjX (TVP38/TMEM64 family)
VNWDLLAGDVTVNDLRSFIEQVKTIYASLGILAAVGLPYVETLFPVLPLFLMTAFNILTYGVFWGYVYTFIGTVSGTIAIFLFMRHVSTRPFRQKWKEKPSVIRYLNWIESTHPALHILVLMVPFAPTFMINYSMGLSQMRLSTFVVITFVSRAIMLVICIPLGLTLISLYEAGSFGGVQILWLTITGLLILASIVVGQIMQRKIQQNKAV